jgi:hypothetical protein
MNIFNFQSLFLFSVGLTLLVSCGEAKFGEDEPEAKPVELSMDGVKLISSGITNARATQTMLQTTYSLNSSNRLLLRFEELSKFKDKILVDDVNRVFVKLTVSDVLSSNIENLKAEITLCPLKTNWMMLATWFLAHPFPGNSKKWKVEGGDFEVSECFVHEEDVDLIDNVLRFDVSSWFTHNIKSRSENYGFVVVSPLEVELYGDDHRVFAPQVNWKE